MFDHTPVLLEPVIEALSIKPNGCYIDGTFGRGGHSLEILKRLGPEGKLIVFDKDPAAMHAAQQKGFMDDARFAFQAGSFTQIGDYLAEHHLQEKVDGILFDLGVSSGQLDDAARGFSFMKEGPLDMRMNPNAGMDAASWLNSAKEEDIVSVLKEYGQERFARRIAGAIVKKRDASPLRTTTDLVDIVIDASPRIEKHKHPATRTFQAVRIFINRELDDLQEVLSQCIDALSIGGKLVIISFHSLEDRIVKQFMQVHAKDNMPADIPITADKLLTRLARPKRVLPTKKEITKNVRARSAVLRIAEKLT